MSLQASIRLKNILPYVYYARCLHYTMHEILVIICSLYILPLWYSWDELMHAKYIHYYVPTTYVPFCASGSVRVQTIMQTIVRVVIIVTLVVHHQGLQDSNSRSGLIPDNAWHALQAI